MPRDGRSSPRRAADELAGGERINGRGTENCVHPFSWGYAKIKSRAKLFAKRQPLHSGGAVRSEGRGDAVAGVGDSGPLLGTALIELHSQLVVILVGADPSPEERITLHKAADHAIMTPNSESVRERELSKLA